MGGTRGHSGLSFSPLPTLFIQSPLSSPFSNRQPMGRSREDRLPPSWRDVYICSPKPCFHHERKPGPASWRRDHAEGDRAILTEAILDQLATMSWQGKTTKTRKAPAEPKLQSDTTMGCRADRPSGLVTVCYAAVADCYAYMHANLLQSCLTLCDPTDGSPPGSPVPGILQERILEWVDISFSKLTAIPISKYCQSLTLLDIFLYSIALIIF